MERRTYGIVFDFDGTLAPDSTSSFLKSWGVEDLGAWWGETNRLITEGGWDRMPAYLWRMVQLSREGERPITADDLAGHGRSLEYYTGVDGFFDRCRDHLAQVDPEGELEFYLVSSGLEEILTATAIADHFQGIWACSFHTGRGGEILFPRNVVSFTEKTRFLFHISKGMLDEVRVDPEAINLRVDPSSYHIPFNRMLYIGDGMTDVPCFTLVQSYGGGAVGVLHTGDKHRQMEEALRNYDKAWELMRARRVGTLHEADYGPDSTLERQVRLLLGDMARRARNEADNP